MLVTSAQKKLIEYKKKGKNTVFIKRITDSMFTLLVKDFFITSESFGFDVSETSYVDFSCRIHPDEV